MLAAVGGLLVGAIAMLWVLTRSTDMDTSGIFDKLFSLLQALLMIRAGGTLRAKAAREEKIRIKLRVQRLQKRLQELEERQ